MLLILQTALTFRVRVKAAPVKLETKHASLLLWNARRSKSVSLLLWWKSWILKRLFHVTNLSVFSGGDQRKSCCCCWTFLGFQRLRWRCGCKHSMKAGRKKKKKPWRVKSETTTCSSHEPPLIPFALFFREPHSSRFMNISLHPLQTVTAPGLSSGRFGRVTGSAFLESCPAALRTGGGGSVTSSNWSTQRCFHAFCRLYRTYAI